MLKKPPVKVKKPTPAKSSIGSYDAQGVELPFPPLPLPDPSVVINPISHGILLFFESSLSPRRAASDPGLPTRAKLAACKTLASKHQYGWIVTRARPVTLPGLRLVAAKPSTGLDCNAAYSVSHTDASMGQPLHVARPPPRHSFVSKRSGAALREAARFMSQGQAEGALAGAAPTALFRARR